MITPGVSLVADITGTLPGWLTLGAVIAAAWSFRRGGGGTAIASLEAANRILEKRVHELEEGAREKDKELAELRGRTDVSLALQPLVDMVALHEQQAATRHGRMLDIMDLMASRLGSEPDVNGS